MTDDRKAAPASRRISRPSKRSRSPTTRSSTRRRRRRSLCRAACATRARSSRSSCRSSSSCSSCGACPELPPRRADRQLILNANPWLLLAAFGVYYLGFPLRGYRWTLLLRGAGTEVRVRDSTEIIFISWLVNCLVPAKLGDVYRAYLLRLNYDRLAQPNVRHGLHRAHLRPVRDRAARPGRRLLELPVGHVARGAARLRDRPGRDRRPCDRPVHRAQLRQPHHPAPAAAEPEWSSSTSASRKASSRSTPRRVPLLAIVTALIWATEAMRLYFVMLALGFDVHLGISGAFFVALIASLLTAIPFTPAGSASSRARWSCILTTSLRGDHDGGGRDHARRPRHQRPVDHRLRRDRLRPVRQDQSRKQRAGRSAGSRPSRDSARDAGKRRMPVVYDRHRRDGAIAGTVRRVG